MFNQESAVRPGLTVQTTSPNAGLNAAEALGLDLNARETINGTIVFLLTGAAMLIGVGAASGAHHPLISISVLLFGGFTAVLVHELGHAIAAWLVGWRVWIIHVAPFALRLDDGSLRVVANYAGPDFAGFVLPSPRAPRHDTRLRGAFVSAGGPIASWLMAGALIAIAVPGPIEHYDVSNVRYVLYALGMFALAAAIGTTLPLVTRGRANDAAQVQAYLDGSLRKRPHAEWTLGLWLYGIEPRHWNADLRASVDAARANPALAWIPGYFTYFEGVRAGNAALARSALAALGAQFNEAALSVLEAYIRAAIEGDTRNANELLTSISSFAEMPAEAIALRELTLAEIDRADGQVQIARNRLARIHGQLVRAGYEKQPIWKDLFAAAHARLTKPQSL